MYQIQSCITVSERNAFACILHDLLILKAVAFTFSTDKCLPLQNKKPSLQEAKETQRRTQQAQRNSGIPLPEY